MDEDFNYATTDWYNAALAAKDNLVLTPPRANEYGRCDVITLSHTMLEGK